MLEAHIGLEANQSIAKSSGSSRKSLLVVTVQHLSSWDSGFLLSRGPGGGLPVNMESVGRLLGMAGEHVAILLPLFKADKMFY